MSKTNLRKTNLNLLLVFEVLMSERHVGRAAARLCLTQSAVSHSLGRLREALNDPLFVRNPKGVEPTPRALELSDTISQILDSARAALNSGPTFDHRRPHTFSIGATDGATNAILVPLMEHLRAAAPEISIRVITTHWANVVSEIDRMHIDMALTVFSTPVARLIRIPIRKMHLVGIARRGHPDLKSPKTLTTERFAALPHLVISPHPDQMDPLEEHLGRLGIKRRVAMIEPHYLAAPLIVARTDMVAIVDRKLAVMFEDACDLMVFEPPFQTPALTIDMLLSTVRAKEPALKWLQSQITSVFSEAEAGATKKPSSDVERQPARPAP